MTEGRSGGPAVQRKAARDVRRQQLIESTVRVLGQKGYAATTIADVARDAGLSTGIVIFHFNSKDQLLASVLEHLARDYHQNWKAAVAAAGGDPAAKLEALMLADFDATVYTPEKLGAWIAFWGETQGRPTYDQICAGLDAERQQVSLALCRELIAAGGTDLDSHIVMRTLEALCDGLWLGVAADGAGHPGRVTAPEARLIVMAALRAFFPLHYAPR